jgi:hypothetical protein
MEQNPTELQSVKTTGPSGFLPFQLFFEGLFDFGAADGGAGFSVTDKNLTFDGSGGDRGQFFQLLAVFDKFRFTHANILLDIIKKKKISTKVHEVSTKHGILLTFFFLDTS